MVETERERRSLDAEMRSRGISPPLGGRGKSSALFLRRHRDRPGTPVNERRLTIVGYREVRLDDDRITVLAVVTAAEDGVWRSDLMRLDPGTAAEIQAGLTGEDPVRVMNRTYRERRETPGKNPTPEGEERDQMPHDATAVANRLIRLAGDEGNELTALQLNKLAYFCQAWMLGLYERPLIEQPILALATGPIILDIYRSFRKHHGDPVRVKPGVRKADFDHMEEDLVQQVYSKYGHLSGIRLSELSHEEDTPWDRVWRQNGQRSIIPRNLMKDHCSRQAQEARECRTG